MIWTDGWFRARHEATRRTWTMQLSLEEHSATRWAILWRFRARLARAEAAALKTRLEEERLVFDTVTRCHHLRIDASERIVEAARKLCKSILPGAHNYIDSLALVALVELIAERDSNQSQTGTSASLKRSAA